MHDDAARLGVTVEMPASRIFLSLLFFGSRFVLLTSLLLGHSS